METKSQSDSKSLPDVRKVFFPEFSELGDATAQDFKGDAVRLRGRSPQLFGHVSTHSSRGVSCSIITLGNSAVSEKIQEIG